MRRNQAFRVTGTAVVKYIAVDHINGRDVIFWEDIVQVFPTVNLIQHNSVVINKLRDASGIRYEPHRIEHQPDDILDIVLSATVEDSQNGTQAYSTLSFRDSRGVASTTVSNDNISSSSDAVDELSEFVSYLDIVPQPISDFSSLGSRLPTQARRNTMVIQNQIDSVAEAIEIAHQSGAALRKGQLSSLIHSKLSSTLQTRLGFESTVIRELRALHNQGATTQQVTLEVLELQKKMNDRLILIQKKTEAILTQQVELAEYPIPRLFIVLPEEPTEYNPANWFRTKFRLHFICECGEHTQPAGSKVVHHLHLAKHEGYLVREPTAFFKKYGPFLMLMLELIKVGSTLAGHVVPALATLNVIELVDSVKQSIDTVVAGIDYSLECIDREMEKLRSSSLGELGNTDRSPMTNQDLANYLSNVEGLEGVELRLLGSFLRTSNADNLLGNLYRMATADGHVKWVCRDHYRAGYKEAQTQRLRDIVKLAKGRFDEQLGTLEISLKSSFAAAEFLDAIVKAKGVLELIVDLNWDCTRKDIEILRNAIKKSMVAILHVDVQRFQPSVLRTQLSSISARYEPLCQILEPINLKSVHLVLPREIMKLSNFTPRRPLYLHRLTYEMAIGNPEVGGRHLKVLSERLKTNSITTSWCYPFREKGAQALSEELKICSTLAALSIARNSIGDQGVQALSEVLKTNATVTTLYISDNSIREKGAQTLSEALKANSTLTTLDMGFNWIGEKGASALSEALKTNSTLTTLNMEYNSIRDIGAQALSEAIKTNSALTTLKIARNSIGEKGAQALSEALKTNSTLTTLHMSSNSIGENGAQALSVALKTNSTLTTLYMSSNSIGEKGSQALSEALKTNRTLASLDISDNSIGDEGVQALSEALMTNLALTTLKMGANSIEEKGVQALSEALKTNSALTTLEMWGNSIGEKGVQALSEALKANSQLNADHFEHLGQIDRRE